MEVEPLWQPAIALGEFLRQVMTPRIRTKRSACRSKSLANFSPHMFQAIRTFLYGATPASYDSPYPLQEAVDRLRAASKPSLWDALSSEAAVGKVSQDHVLLQRAIPLVGNSFKPFFIGRFEPTARGSRLVGHFTMHRSVKVLNTFWFGFCLLWTVLALAAAVSSGSLESWYFPLFGVGLLVAGVLMVELGRWFARNDPAWLTDVITNALGARALAAHAHGAGHGASVHAPAPVATRDGPLR